MGWCGVGKVNLREIGCLYSAFLLFCSFQPSIFTRNLLCEVFCLSFLFHQSSAFVFKVFTFRRWWEQVGQSPLSCQWACWATLPAAKKGSPGPGHSSAGTSAGLPVPVLFVWFPSPVYMSEIPWSKQSGGWETRAQGKGSSALILELPLLLRQELHPSWGLGFLSVQGSRGERSGEFHRLPNALLQPKGVLQSFRGSQVICGKRRGLILWGKKPNSESPTLQLCMNHELESSYQKYRPSLPLRQI